ncbi:MAG: group III truncated hemoglobin [Burkholderiales bacterium]|jgi:hemoglobin|nr:MAG: group III truncated hemoglobin [Burkholderiales bacterium]
MTEIDPTLVQLRQLVDAFYERVRRDEEIGPIFNDAIIDWPHHLDKLADFWHSVVYGSGRYPGGLMMRHFMHRDRIRPEHFERWLALWQATTAELMPPDMAELLQARAARVGESIKLGLFYRAADHAPKS